MLTFFISSFNSRLHTLNLLSIAGKVVMVKNPACKKANQQERNWGGRHISTNRQENNQSHKKGSKQARKKLVEKRNKEGRM